MNWKALFKAIGTVVCLFSLVGGLLFVLLGIPILVSNIHPYAAIVSIWFIWSIFCSFLWPFKKGYPTVLDYLKRFAYALLVGSTIIGMLIGGIKAMTIWPITSQYVFMGLVLGLFCVSVVILIMSIYKDEVRK